MKKHTFSIGLFLGCWMAVVTPGLHGQETGAPSLISYQGKLVQANGSPYADGSHAVTFRLYDAPTGGTLIWGATYTVPVAGGVFSVALGAPGGTAVAGAAVNDLRFAFGASNRYLELTVAGEPLLPRQQMNSVPFALSSANGNPSGTVIAFAGDSAPAGWVLCDGRSLDGALPENKALHAVIGTRYGVDGAKFRVPDLRGRTVIGTGQGDTWNGTGGATNWALATKFGAEKHQMTVAEMPSHNHGVNDPGHSHSTQSARGGWGFLFGFDGQNQGGGASGRVPTNHVTTGITIQNSGNDQPHNNMQPSLVLNYIIKL